MAKSAENLLRRLYRETKTTELSPDMVHLYLQESGMEELANPNAQQGVALRTKKGMIRPRGANQQRYVKAILDNDINFGVGPAGTGKTYLAVACAVDALEREQVRRILLVRPAVEAGESSASCRATWRRRSTPTCARCTTRSTKCSASSTWQG